MPSKPRAKMAAPKPSPAATGQIEASRPTILQRLASLEVHEEANGHETRKTFDEILERLANIEAVLGMS